MKLKIEKVELEELYWQKNLSTYKIADLLDCTFTTILNRLKEYKIRKKTPSFARNKYYKKILMAI